MFREDNDFRMTRSHLGTVRWFEGLLRMMWLLMGLHHVWEMLGKGMSHLWRRT